MIKLQDHPNLIDDIIEEFVKLHVEVLKSILNGKTFYEIKQTFANRLQEFNYDEVSSFLSLLRFNEIGEVVGAYPISLIPTNIKITAEGIGRGYAMCAIDSLGVAFLFNVRTDIESVDPVTGVQIRITVNPNQVKPKPNPNIIVTMPKTVEEAAFCCPHVRFLSCERRKVTPEGVISFMDAMKYGVSFFSRFNLKKKFRSRLSPLNHLYNAESLTADELIHLYSNSPRFNLLSSLFPDDFGIIMVNILCEKGIIEKQESSENIRFTLTYKGRRILNTFRR